jgi:gamma-butyrobetaine dioxygenase
VTTGPATPPDSDSSGPDPATPDADAVVEVLDLFDRRGDGTYGEVVDQRHHALQCADRAAASGAPDALVAAALLHDIGHLLSGPDLPGVDRTAEDDRHEAVGARFLAPRFGSEVSRAVALHVVAKRYRCTVDPDYYRALSPTSRATLVAQGGRLDAGDLARFERHAGFADALAVRDWDEEAKDPDREVADIDVYVPVLRRLAHAATSSPSDPGPADSDAAG